MKNLKNICIVLMFLVISTNAKDNYQIQWQLENPFKFFTEKDVYRKMKKLYDEVNASKYENSKGLAFERALQSKDWDIGTKYHKLGWATYFAIDGYEKTCWDQNKMLYKITGKCSNYINPKEHNIVVKLDNAKGKICSWFVNGKEKEKDINCSKDAILTIPYLDKNQSIEVVVENKLKFTEQIAIKDILIVGLGDSYGSGEGNPDIPVTFNNNNSNKDRVFVQNLYLPRKDYQDSTKKYLPAKWLDRRCHRSLYSYQFKTALQLSMENPKQAITFINFSCTGATTKNIINKNKNAQENLGNIEALYYKNKKNDKKFRKKNIYPQIQLLEHTLNGINRKIDLLLLSTGGNDVNFAKYVMNVALKNTVARTLVKIPNVDTGKDLNSTLQKNYNEFDKSIGRFLKDVNSSRIILTAYPNILLDENEVLCKGNRKVFDIPFGQTSKREQRIKDTQDFLLKPLFKIQNELAIKELKWNLVTTHVEKYKNHGFCAKDSSIKDSAEIFVIPHKKKKRYKWMSFNPKDYRAYSEMQRWMRIPIDSILTINLTKKWSKDLGFTDETSGIMHPNAR